MLSFRFVAAREITHQEGRSLAERIWSNATSILLVSVPTNVATSMKKAIGSLHESPSTIIETGSSAWGTDSSVMFDSFVQSFGGEFLSVDIRLEPLFACANG